MTRVPTSATYASMISNSLATKELLDLYTYQSMTGLKSQTYSGYGQSASSIVSLEATLGVTMNYMETNKILQTDVNTMNTAITAIDDAFSDFKSALTSFSGLSLESITPDQTGGELKLSDTDMGVYQGKTITANGIEYTIGGTGANSIPLDIATDTPQTLMENIANTIPEITYNANADTLAFDLYTINGYSTILNTSGVTTGEPHELTQDQQQMLREVQSLAFSTMQILADTLNVQGATGYCFGGGVSLDNPVDFPFSTLEEFQNYYDGINLEYPSSQAALLSNKEFSFKDAGELSINYAGGNTNSATITSANPEGFFTDNISANSLTSGNLLFSADNQSITASVGGTFNSYQEGDLMIIEGTTGNNGVYEVASISTDGKTIELKPQEGTAQISDETVDVAANPDTVEFKSTFPLNALVELEGMSSYGISTQNVQITGVSADGTELYVKVDNSTFPTGTFNIPQSDNWKLEAQSYYQGGTASTEKYISENQSISFDITAMDPAFANMFLALGEIAQGNLVDMRDLSNPMTGTVDAAGTMQRVEDALDLVQKALFDPTASSVSGNADFYSIQSKINSNLITLNSTSESQDAIKLNLENSISSLKNVNQEEAAVKALLASTQLEASYAAMQNAMSLSLINYLK